MKRIIAIVLIFASLLITSCAKKQSYICDYPGMYTLEYCSENYTRFCHNLKALVVAKNYIGEQRTDKYYAIKDVPLEKYLVMTPRPVIFGSVYSVYLCQNINCSDFPIVDYTAIKAELFWEEPEGVYDDTEDPDDIRASWGTCVFYESVAEVNAQEFQDYICSAIESKNYYKLNCRNLVTKYIDRNVNQATKLVYLSVRVYFSEYENLVWDACVVSVEGYYYITISVPKEEIDDTAYGNYIDIQIPVTDDILRIIENIA